jgi:hypothetical protein
MRSHSQHAVSELPTETTFTREMREHYARTGAYRAEDVHRVLGPPWEAVEIKTISDLEPASRTPKVP